MLRCLGRRQDIKELLFQFAVSEIKDPILQARSCDSKNNPPYIISRLQSFLLTMSTFVMKKFFSYAYVALNCHSKPSNFKKKSTGPETPGGERQNTDGFPSPYSKATAGTVDLPNKQEIPLVPAPGKLIPETDTKVSPKFGPLEGTILT